jgi:ligand-binding sensor domain-containing protein
MAACMLLVCRVDGFAQNPSLDVSQYAHASWKISAGFSDGLIRAIAQTADGYLWLGTEFGLRRFDGVRAVPWEPPPGQHLPTSDIRSLQGARDGRLWIGTFRGLASWKDGKLSHYPELDGQVIEALLEDREGTIWVAGWAPSVGRLCRIQAANIQCYGEDGRFGSGVTPVYEDSGGNLWAGAMNGLWRWKLGSPTRYPMPDPAQRIYALAESDDGGILVATHSGVTKLRNGKTEAYPLPAGLQFQPHRLFRDRSGGLWIGALVDSGLVHIHERKADLFTTANGLSGASVTAIFEDREGSIWVATADGLDRFREFAITTISVQQGLSSQGFGSILAARDGSIWLGTSEGLNKWNQGEITVYRNRSQRDVRGASQPTGLIVGRGADWKRTVREITDNGLPGRTAESIFEDHRGQIWVGTQSGVAFLKAGKFAPVASVPYGVVHSITGDSAGNLWMSHQEGLFHVLDARLVERIPWARLGRREPATAVLHDARQGGVWLGFRDGGVAYFNDGQIRASYAADEGLGEGMVRTFYTDASGSLWAATDGGLSRIKAGRVQTLTSRNGLPCNMIHWMMEDDADSVWLYTACGLVRIAQSDLDAWASNPKQTIQAALFDSSDGVTSRRFPGGYSATVAKSADGTLWFLRPGGVSVIDPHHLAFNKLPPPVHIEQVTADDTRLMGW